MAPCNWPLRLDRLVSSGYHANGLKLDRVVSLQLLLLTDLLLLTFSGCRRHQREVGTGYFDLVSTVVSQGQSSTTALNGSTEASQFHE